MVNIENTNLKNAIVQVGTAQLLGGITGFGMIEGLASLNNALGANDPVPHAAALYFGSEMAFVSGFGMSLTKASQSLWNKEFGKFATYTVLTGLHAFALAENMITPWAVEGTNPFDTFQSFLPYATEASAVVVGALALAGLARAAFTRRS